MPAYLTTEEIQASHDVMFADVALLWWGGGDVRVRSLSLAEVQQALAESKGDRVAFTLAVAVVGCLEPKFEAADAEWLASKNFSAVSAIAKEICRLSGIDWLKLY